MLLEYIILFLALSLVFYVLFGGADFGAGILEIITHKKNRESIAHAIGPVWEANHVWLILVVVILFMGFPKIYSTVSLYLHIPIVLLLVGIIFRGTAFAYMHYDAIKDRSNAVYNWSFKISSLLTPMFLGIIVGSVMMGEINPEAKSFYGAFIAPWFNLFTLSMGLFCICLFTFLAAVFMIGETDKQDQKKDFIRAAKKTQIATVLSGGLVFAMAAIYGYPLFQLFFSSWISITSMILATLSLLILWRFLNKRKVLHTRVLAGTQILLILVSWFWIQHPVVVNLKSGTDLTFHNTAAPEATLLQLVLALVIGSLLILPFLFYLMKVFKSPQFSTHKD